MKRSSRRCAILALAMMASGFVTCRASADEPTVVIGPYLQNLTDDGVVVRWVTADPATPSEFVYHRAPITGGKPDTEYDYRVGPDHEFTGTFRTAPERAVPFRFVVYGDTRTQADVHGRIINGIVSEKPAFVVHTGDCVADGRKADLWQTEFFGPAAPLLSKVVLWPVLGNHERNSALYYNLFDLPGNERYYSFDYAQVHFVVLDSNPPELPKEHRNEARWMDEYNLAVDRFWRLQIAWLLQDFKAHRDARLTAVCMHSPLYSSTGKPSRVAKYERMRDRLEAVFETNGVDVVFSGHDHYYQRHVANGIQYVVTGGGGAPLYDAGPKPPTEVVRAKAYHYVTVSVERTGAQAKAVSINGNTLDTFTFGSRR